MPSQASQSPAGGGGSWRQVGAQRCQRSTHVLIRLLHTNSSIVTWPGSAAAGAGRPQAASSSCPLRRISVACALIRGGCKAFVAQRDSAVAT